MKQPLVLLFHETSPSCPSILLQTGEKPKTPFFPPSPLHFASSFLAGFGLSRLGCGLGRAPCKLSSRWDCSGVGSTRDSPKVWCEELHLGRGWDFVHFWGFFFLFAFWAGSEKKLKTEEAEGGSQIPFQPFRGGTKPRAAEERDVRRMAIMEPRDSALHSFHVFGGAGNAKPHRNSVSVTLGATS